MKWAGVIALAGVAFAICAPQARAQGTLGVRVTMTKRVCGVAPRVVAPGTITFSIANRTRGRRLFTIAGRRSAYIRARRSGRLQVRLTRAGTYRYFCLSRGRIRNPRTGVLAVRQEIASPAAPSAHRIAVRPAGHVNELYDTETGARFVPRGNNYIRLADQPEVGLYHSTFNVDLYDGARAEEALARMRAQGYNAVRVFLNGLCQNACIGDRMRGISSPYAQNVADFLGRAKAHGLFVILTIDHVPINSPYANLLNAEPRTYVDKENLNFLTPGGVRANADFWRDFAAELIRLRAATDVVLAYELRNEAYFDGASKPFTLASGLLQAPNGRTYDLSRQAERDALMDDGLTYWVDRVRAAIRMVDPTALVAIGFFEPHGPNPSRKGDDRLVRTRAVIRTSQADFVDIHPYPRVNLTLAKYMENFGIDGTEAKPVVMGEFGAFRSSFPQLDEVPRELQSWQGDSCAYGVDGWLVWTWDTEEQGELWNARSGDGVIERALAPAARPEPCAPVSGPHNLALGQPATASRFDPARPPSHAVDGSRLTNWASGDFPPQWIQIDLGSPQAIGRLRFYVDQFPAGYTEHRVWGQATALEAPRLLHTFAGYTDGDAVLQHTPPAPWRDVRYVKIETVSSPSWVGWRELELLSTG